MAIASQADIGQIIADNPGIGRDRLARIAGVSPRTARRALLAARGATPRTAKPQLPGALTLADIRRKYDVAERIRLTIKERLIGADAFFDDAKFRELCGVHVNNWRRHATLPEFAEFQVKLSGIVHWASPANVRKVREMTGVI